MIAFQTTTDLFYFSLSIFVACMTILLSLLLIKIIRILSHVQSITDEIKIIVNLINQYVGKPLEVIIALKEYLINFLAKQQKSEEKNEDKNENSKLNNQESTEI